MAHKVLWDFGTLYCLIPPVYDQVFSTLKTPLFYLGNGKSCRAETKTIMYETPCILTKIIINIGKTIFGRYMLTDVWQPEYGVKLLTTTALIFEN